MTPITTPSPTPSLVKTSLYSHLSATNGVGKFFFSSHLHIYSLLRFRKRVVLCYGDGLLHSFAQEMEEI